MKKHKRRLSLEEKRRVIFGYRESGQSQREYAQRAGIGMSTLGLWLRQEKTWKGPRWLEVDIERGALTKGEACYRLVLPGGIRFEINRGFEISEVQGLLGILRGNS